jgi:hypothetical protein
MLALALCFVGRADSAEAILPLPFEPSAARLPEPMPGHLLRWRFRIKEPDVQRLDVHLRLGEFEFLRQSFTGEMVETAAAVTAAPPDLELTIDFLTDIGVPKWRVHCGLRGERSSSLHALGLPTWMQEMDFRLHDWGSVAKRSGDRFVLVDFTYQDGALRRRLPLTLKIVVNGTEAPPTALDWKPRRGYVPPPAELTTEALAAAFGWKGQLSRREILEALDSKSRGDVLVWGLSFSAAPGTFCPVSVVAYERGTRLTEACVAQLTAAEARSTALRQKFREEQLRAAEAIPDPVKRSVRRNEIMTSRDALDNSGVESFELNDGRRAYVQLLGFGPGGSAFGFLVPSADGKRDLMLSVTCAHEGGSVLKDAPENHEYYVAMQEHPMELVKRAGRAIFETATW